MKVKVKRVEGKRYGPINRIGVDIVYHGGKTYISFSAPKNTDEKAMLPLLAEAIKERAIEEVTGADGSQLVCCAKRIAAFGRVLQEIEFLARFDGMASTFPITLVDFHKTI